MLSNSDQEEVHIYEAPRSLNLKEQRDFQIGLEVALVVGLLLVVFGLRFYHLTYRSIWLDEATDVVLAHDSSFIETLFFYRAWIIHPPLFFPIMHIWVKLFGMGDFALRIFSVIMSLLAIGTIYFMIRRLLNRKIALTAGLLLAVSPLNLFWSQSIRPYAWFTFLVIMSMGVAYYVSEKPRQNWRWLLYGLSGSMLIYAHYLGMHVVLSQAVFLFLVLFKDWRALLRLAITLALVAASFLPYLGNFLEQSRTGPSFYVNNGPSQLFDTIEALSSWYLPRSMIFVGGTIFLPLYVLGISWLWQKSRKVGLWLVIWSFIPVFTSWLSSLIRPNFSIRYMSFCIPAFLVIVAAGLWSLVDRKVQPKDKSENAKVARMWRLLPYFLLGLAIAVNLASDFNYDKNYSYQNWRDIVNYIVANRQEGDVIFLANPDGYTFTPFDYYYVYQLGAPGNMPRRVVSSNITGEEVPNVFKGTNRVWIVTLYEGSNLKWIQERLRPQFPENFKSISQKVYPSTQSNIGVELFVKTP